MKKIYNKISIQSRIINYLFKFSSSKAIFSNENRTRKYIKYLAKKNKNYNIPKKLGMKLEKNYSNLYSYNGTLDKNTGKILLYIHGGSYIEEAIDYQIKFAMKIAKKSNSTLIMPIYPLAPKSNYKNMYKLIDNIYRKIIEKTNNINFLGDSAGGGFILSYSMYLRNNKKIQPKNIIMMSPWLDITLSNPELKISEKKDPMSGIIGNQYAGKLWADGLDTKNYLVSPIYGKFNDLGKITIITGENDILKPDCLRLCKILEDNQINFNYIEYKGQGHDFGAYPTKEGKMVIEDIAKIIKKGDNNE